MVGIGRIGIIFNVIIFIFFITNYYMYSVLECFNNGIAYILVISHNKKLII